MFEYFGNKRCIVKEGRAKTSVSINRDDIDLKLLLILKLHIRSIKSVI